MISLKFEIFLSSVGKSIILVENVSLCLSFVKFIRDISKNHLIICTDRTKRVEIYSSEIVDALGAVRKVDINQLSLNEIKKFTYFLNANILWGDASELETESKQIEFIQKRCSSELRGVLFSLFDGGAIKHRIEEIFNEFNIIDKDYRDLIILVCVLNFAYARNNLSGHVYSYEDLLNLRVDFDLFSKKIEDSNISEFLNAENGAFTFKSSTFSKYYLNKFVDPSYLFELVFKVLKNLEVSYMNDDEFLYKDFSKALLQFNLYREIYSSGGFKSARMVINQEKFHESIYSFYNKCRVLKITNRDPLFVVQMSMVELDRGNFDECVALVNSAEKMCRPGFDRYQIETHKAEVMIRRSKKFGMSPHGDAEEQAFQIVSNVVSRRNERYHPFGVMDKIIDVYENHAASADEISKRKIISTLKSIILLTNKFPSELKERYHIIFRVSTRANNLLKRI